MGITASSQNLITVTLPTNTLFLESRRAGKLEGNEPGGNLKAP